jgi:hypothetical protein
MENIALSRGERVASVASRVRGYFVVFTMKLLFSACK